MRRLCGAVAHLRRRKRRRRRVRRVRDPVEGQRVARRVAQRACRLRKSRSTGVSTRAPLIVRYDTRYPALHITQCADRPRRPSAAVCTWSTRQSSETAAAPGPNRAFWRHAGPGCVASRVVPFQHSHMRFQRNPCTLLVHTCVHIACSRLLSTKFWTRSRKCSPIAGFTVHSCRVLA